MFTRPNRQLATPGTLAAPGKLLSAAELQRWTLLVVALAYWANVVRTTGEADATGLALLVDSVLARGAFCLAAWMMVAGLACRTSTAAAPASRRHFIIAVAVCLLCAIPVRQSAIAAIVVLALMSARSMDRLGGRRMAALLFGLAAEMVWTSTYLLPLHDAVATLDAVVVRALLGLGGIGAVAHGNIVDNTGANFGIEILAPCSSSFPLAGIGLAFLVTTIYQGRLPCRRDLSWLAGGLLASIALTEIRLTWMATREADYFWLHDGGGVTLYTLAAVSLAALFPLLASRTPRAPERFA